jgi:ATP-binding cassette subfamily C protein
VLFDGSVAENVARLSPEANDEAIVEAAKRTGAHEMILGLPDGYDFQVSAGGAALSGGQRQRIALARAFYGSPVVVVMDEPDSNLDAEGTMALSRAVEGHKKRGGAAVIVAHRHGAFAQCDTVYLMEGGRPVSATSGRGAAPVRSLQFAGGSKAEEAPPAAGRSSAGAPKTPAAVRGTTGSRPSASVRAEGRATADSGEKRPVVTVVRGGQKTPAVAPVAKTPSSVRRSDAKPADGAPAANAPAPTRSPLTRRQRMIAGAIARVRGVRARGDGNKGRATSSNPARSGPVAERRIGPDDAS